MKQVMTLALLAFGLAAFTHGQNVSETSQRKDQGQGPAQASAAGLDFGDQEVQTISKQLGIVLTNKTVSRLISEMLIRAKALGGLRG